MVSVPNSLGESNSNGRFMPVLIAVGLNRHKAGDRHSILLEDEGCTLVADTVHAF
jgi:hypothetical protein